MSFGGIISAPTKLVTTSAATPVANKTVPQKSKVVRPKIKKSKRTVLPGNIDVTIFISSIHVENV